MQSAIGLVETKGLVGLIEATDAMAKAANVAVVKPNDVVTTRHEFTAELFVPSNHLRAEPHHEKQGAATLIAKGVVFELDSVRF